LRFQHIAGCEHCRGEEAHLPFDWIIADVLDKEGPFEFLLTEPAMPELSRYGDGENVD
jgi:hypothetical protein